VNFGAPKHETQCPGGCGMILDDWWGFCPACGRAKQRGDPRPPARPPVQESAAPGNPNSSKDGE
jgi:hypothetical protein